MTTLTERYLAAALRGIPEGQRADVERELRSSIADAVEDRVAAGEERGAAERATLEALGNPVLLAAGYTGRPQFLVGPELFPVWRHILTMLLPIVVPIVAVVVTLAAILGDASYVEAILGGIGAAISTGIQLAFWLTLVFVLLERADVAREARDEIVDATGRWTIEMLPTQPDRRIGVGETVGELVTVLLSIGGLLFLRDTTWFAGQGGDGVTILDPGLSAVWLPVLLALLVATGACYVLVHLVGRWTWGLVIGFTLLQVAFAGSVVWLALNGMLVDHGFAAEVGWDELAAGDGAPMRILAAAVTLITAWEIIDVVRRTRQPRLTAALVEGRGR